jgi:hypothetical protein
MLMNRLVTFASFASGLLALGFAPTANAQYTGLITDVPVVTVGHGGGTGPSNGSGYCSTAAVACQTNYGSIDAPLVDGLTIAAFVDLPGPVKTNLPYFRTQLAVTGYPTDPGQASLARVECGNVTYRGAQASNYSFSGGRASWYWNIGDGAQPAFQGRTSVSCRIYRVGDSGWVRPKYQIAGLTYAPPGSRSTANYTSGFQNGRGTTSSTSFMSGVTYRDSVSVGVGLGGVWEGNVTYTNEVGWSQTRDSNFGVTVTQQTSNGLIVPGPASSAAGVNHDFDTIYVWLNPEIFTMLFNSGVVVGGYAYDARDPVIGMDVVPLTVGQLKGTQAIPPNLWTRLNRSWDPAQGGLTTANFQDILLAHPFAFNPGYNPNTDPSRRYELPLSGNPPLPANVLINYTPVPAGGQPTGQTYSANYSSTSTAGKGAKHTNDTTFTVEASESFIFAAKLTAKMTSITKWSTTNQWSQTVTNGTSQAAGFTIFPPLASDNYTGPTAIQVWKDNVYGTFMFYPLY